SQLQEIPDLRGSIDIKNNELKSIKDPIETITINDFFTYCQEMIDKIKEIGLDEGLGQSDGKKDRLMNAPLSGKSA
ncbi:hypothetical protein N7517_010687, partial [Penicillium concentricum]